MAYLVIAIIGILWLGNHHGDLTLDLFIDAESWWLDLLFGVGAGMMIIALWRVARAWIPAMTRVEAWMLETIGPLDGSEVFALALISGFSEELFFRGAMQSSWGWGWSLAAFTLLHWGPGRDFRYWTLFALLAGGVFSFLTLSRGNLLAAIVAHIVVNGINMRLLMNDSTALESLDL